MIRMTHSLTYDVLLTDMGIKNLYNIDRSIHLMKYMAYISKCIKKYTCFALESIDQEYDLIFFIVFIIVPRIRFGKKEKIFGKHFLIAPHKERSALYHHF